MNLLSPVLTRAAIALFALIMTGCASAPKEKASYAPARPPELKSVGENNGAIYQAGLGLMLFEDQRARRVGDILTIVLVEKTDAAKKASTKTNKKDEIDMPNPTLFGSPFALPGALRNDGRTINLENDILADRAFDGGGDSSQSNRLSGSVSVTVAEVYSNGNLLVRGEKQLTINQGDEYVRFSGIIRPSDIRPDNSVLSTQVADARITYVGEGALANANEQGWLSRVFSSSWWPF